MMLPLKVKIDLEIAIYYWQCAIVKMSIRTSLTHSRIHRFVLFGRELFGIYRLVHLRSHDWYSWKLEDFYYEVSFHPIL